MPDIFSYLDYRRFLKDAFEEKRKTAPNFSLRSVSQKINLKSTGFLSMVVQGKRSISERIIIELGGILKLNKKERDYFRSLVYFNQAQTHSEKNHFYSEILSLQKAPVRTVNRDQYEFYDKWYYSALRELAAVYDIGDDYERCARLLNPPIRPSEVKTALEVLARLGLIVKNDAGIYRRTDAVITSGSAVQSFAVRNFQLAAMDLAKSACDRFPKEERELSTVTMSIDAQAYEIIRKKIARLRAEIMELARSVQKPERVYHINLHLFPLSQKNKETDS